MSRFADGCTWPENNTPNKCQISHFRQVVCMYDHTYSRVWINRVRLPILLVVSWTGKMNIPMSPCVPKNLVSRDGSSRPVPRQPAHLHTQTESGAYLRDSSRVPRRRPFSRSLIVVFDVTVLYSYGIFFVLSVWQRLFFSSWQSCAARAFLHGPA